MRFIPALAIGILGLLAVGAACGGDGPSPTPSPPVAQRSPAAAQPAVTPELSPDEAIQTLCLTVEQSYPQIEREFSVPITETVRRILARLGLEVVAEGTPCDATLTFALTGESLWDSYSPSGIPIDILSSGISTGSFCHTGAKFNGQATLAIPERAPLTLPISAKQVPPSSTYDCPGKTGAPFGRVWPRAVLDGLAELWGIQALTQTLEDEDEDVREAAIQALGEIGPQAVEAVPALIDTLQEHEDHDVREAGAEVLGMIGPDAKEAVPALIQTLEEDFWVREAAAEALGEIGPEEGVVPALIQALEDAGPSVSRSAADALEAITGQDFGEDAARWRQWWEEQ